MKAALYKNIDVVRIPIKAGVSEYYFPQNVAWAGKVVDKLVVVAPTASCIDPMDGVTPVMDSATIANLYFNLYNSDDLELTHDLSWEQLSHRNNHALELHTKLNLSLCKLYFTQAPTSDCTLLLYVYYGTQTREDYDYPQHSVTVEFPMAANEQLDLRYIINTYLHALPKTLKGILAWNAETNPAYITLRDYALTYNIREAHTELMRPDMNAGTNNASDCQAYPFFTADLDIDFDYSHIRNAQNSQCTQKLTFLY